MRTCGRCGIETDRDTLACEGCGQPFPAPSLGAAKASLVLAILSYPLLCAMGFGAITAALAVLIAIVALVRSRGAASVVSGRTSALAGILLGGACLAIVTVLTQPALRASRRRESENLAIADIRAILQAEFEYSKANGDMYDTLECLAAPARCISKYDPARPAFLEARLASARTRLNYTRAFHPGPPPDPRPVGASPSSLSAYAYVAVPIDPSSGWRSFCGDGSGRICAIEGGATPVVKDGLCAESCPDLR